MYSSKYMFVKYEKEFPVRLSRQKGRKNLVIPHYHEDAEILKVACGRVVIGAGKESINCQNGDIVVFYPNTMHQVCAESDDAEIISLSYKTDITNFAGRFLPKVGGFQLFEKAHSEYDKMASIFSEVVGLFARKTDTFGLEMTASLMRFSAVFIRDGIMTAELQAGQSRLYPAFEFIEQNLGSVIKISDFETLLNLSKEHIIRLFKSETGKTPTEFILDFKIKRAVEMLKEGRASITEISENLGFSNPSHFSKVFKVRVNMTPREYKNSLN